LIQKNKQYKLAGQDKLRITADMSEVKERIMVIQELFGRLG